MKDEHDAAGPLAITDALVTHLLETQHPDLAHIELGRHYARADHTTVRIGDEWGIRLPTHAGLDPYYARSHRVLAEHRYRWTFPVGTSEREGLPDESFAYHWEITNWITASNAALVPLSVDAGAALGEALSQIHVPANDAAPHNPRTMPRLVTYAAGLPNLVQAARTDAPPHLVLDDHAIVTAWSRALEADPAASRIWTHGRIEPQSVLSDRGDMAGILWWEFFGAGDAAADLGMASSLLTPDGAAAMYEAYGPVGTGVRQRAAGYQVRELLRQRASADHNVVRSAWRGLVDYGFATLA